MEEHEQVLTQLLSMLHRIEEKVDALSKLPHEVERIRSAFVDGDFDGHRRAHEAKVIKAKERKELMNSALKDALRVIITAAVVFIASALWYYGTKDLRS